MKHIRKGRTPQALAKFKRDNAATPQAATYRGLPPEVRRALVQRLLEEQGRLCGYTMRRIGAAGAPDYHIEHIRAQSRYSALQIDYKNMLLCAPEGACAWGARSKDKADVNDSNFVSPLREDCEARFVYRLTGEMKVAEESDAAAHSTLKLLNLNHPDLVAQRSEALRQFGLGPHAKRPLSSHEASRLSATICQPSADGDFETFCVAIRSAAEKEAHRLRGRSARTRAAR